MVMSTPEGKLSFFSSSTVLTVGSIMSMRRLCVRSSNCSILFLLMCTERFTEYFSILVGSGTGPETRAPVRFAVDNISGALVDCAKIVALESYSYSLSCHIFFLNINYERAGLRAAPSCTCFKTFAGTCSKWLGSIEYEARPLESERMSVA